MSVAWPAHADYFSADESRFSPFFVFAQKNSKYLFCMFFVLLVKLSVAYILGIVCWNFRYRYCIWGSYNFKVTIITLFGPKYQTKCHKSLLIERPPTKKHQQQKNNWKESWISIRIRLNCACKLDTFAPQI